MQQGQVSNEDEIDNRGNRADNRIHGGDAVRESSGRTEFPSVAARNPETKGVSSAKAGESDSRKALGGNPNFSGDRSRGRISRNRPGGDYSEDALSAELRRLGAAPELDTKRSPHVLNATSPLQVKDLQQSPHVGIEPAGRKPKQRNDQPPHVPHCEWRASNKRTDGELSWRLLAVIEWLDPVSGEKKKKTQHVGYLPASAWGLIRKFDYETRQKLVEKEIGAKARASRESLEAYRDEAIRLSNVGIGSPSGRTSAD